MQISLDCNEKLSDALSVNKQTGLLVSQGVRRCADGTLGERKRQRIPKNSLNLITLINLETLSGPEGDGRINSSTIK